VSSVPEQARPPTIVDVARRAGVSKSVVSRVLSGYGVVATGTAARVRAAAEELGYVTNAMARGMAAHRTRTIGAFVRDASHPFYGHLLSAMQQRAAALGYRVVTTTGAAGSFAAADERRALETLVGLQVEGLIVCTALLRIEDVLPFAKRVPTVVAGRPATEPTVSTVYVDEVSGGRGLADHVWSLGHRRVAVVRIDRAVSMTQHPRGAEMSRRLRELGAEVEDLPHARVHDRPRDMVRDLVDRGCTALMTPTDHYAVEVLEAMADAGLCAPEDLSVTGYDGLFPLNTPLLGLTTWVQPLDVVGAEAVSTLVARLDGEHDGRSDIPVQGYLVPGRTAGTPRA
jgi:DNA-binding LacI/PurR family transcriptional regulator